MYKITVLGCGSSGGVPYVGCQCPTCSSADPKNTRMRQSILIEDGQGTRLLMDTSPDLRQQSLAYGIETVDAILYTHAHADHSHGIDDVRGFNYNAKQAIDCYADKATIERLYTSFSYVFAERKPEWGWYKPALIAHEIEAYQHYTIAGCPVQTFLQFHGKSETLGYRFGKFAYSTDVNKLPEASLEALESIDVWLVDCLRYTTSPTHADLDMTLGWIARVKPKLAVLIHMGHEMEYHSLKAKLPPNIIPAYDGMVIDMSSESFVS